MKATTKKALLACLLCTPIIMNAQSEESANGAGKSNKEEGNRNVMLNASSANGPREIQMTLIILTVVGRVLVVWTGRLTRC